MLRGWMGLKGFDIFNDFAKFTALVVSGWSWLAVLRM